MSLTTTTADATATGTHGEELRVPERVILAPAVGVFQPSADGVVTAEGQEVTAGQVVGVIEARGQAHEVRSSFSGFLMGLMAHPGERVRQGQPVAWLRAH
ncbi:MAG: biotin/lipoyl-containing protein [Acidimicrobiales bacterium]